MTDRKLTLGERVTAVETWTTEHEKRCGDRYRVLTWAIGTIGAIILAVSGFGLSQLYMINRDQAQATQQLVAQLQADRATVTVQTAPQR